MGPLGDSTFFLVKPDTARLVKCNKLKTTLLEETLIPHVALGLEKGIGLPIK